MPKYHVRFELEDCDFDIQMTFPSEPKVGDEMTILDKTLYNREGVDNFEELIEEEKYLIGDNETAVKYICVKRELIHLIQRYVYVFKEINDGII